MSFAVVGRQSDSPYINMVWHGYVQEDYAPVCPASARWNLLFAKVNGEVTVSVEGATSQRVPKTQKQGSEFLVIRFKLGVYMPYIPAGQLLDTDAILPQASDQSFWLDGFSWQQPAFDNVEEFVNKLVREGVLVSDQIVKESLQETTPDTSVRTVRRHFSHTTGLSPKAVQQIDRANQAVEFLSQGKSILDTVFELGYSDQPHMTRSLKRYIGTTPAEIVRTTRIG